MRRRHGCRPASCNPTPTHKSATPPRATCRQACSLEQPREALLLHVRPLRLQRRLLPHRNLRHPHRLLLVHWLSRAAAASGLLLCPA